MKPDKEPKEDERIGKILELIIQFAKSDFKPRLDISGKGDEVDAIITGLNTLGEELQAKEFRLYRDEKRINEIMDILLKYTLMDFSKKISVGDEGDELDAIIVGLNTLSEELESHIQQLKEREDQLKEYQHFFNNNNDLCGIANTAGYFETINTNFSIVLGYSEKEFCAIPFIDLIHPDDVASTLQIYDNLKGGALVINFVNRYRKKDGTYIWLDWNATPDVLTGKLYCVARDITERRKTEEQLQAVNKELEAFSYSVSHDLRAPLRAVHGYAQMLKEDFETQLNGDGSRVINNIMSNAKKMGQLIDDLLAFSRLSRKELQKSTIAMHEMVDSLCDELKNEQDQRQVQYIIKNLHPAQGDTATIKQVWTNLLSNALKYSRGKAQSVIEAGSQENGQEIVYYVKDNGAGFDMRYADKLFGVFQRLHSETEFEGTGVGLAIVQRVIAKHGGRVWAEGKVNEGATFYFTLNKS